MIIARNRLFLPKFSEMRWPKAQVKIQREGGEVVFKSDAFAWGVCIDLEGETSLPDNFFDVWPGMEYRLPWPKTKKLPEIIHTGNL